MENTKIKLRNSIRFQFSFLIILSSILLFIAVVSIIISRFRSNSVDNARFLTENLAKEYANMAIADLNEEMNLVRGLSISAKTNWQLGRAGENSFYKEILENVYKENPDVLALWINMELRAIEENYYLDYGRERHTMVTLKGHEDYIQERINLEGDDLQGDYYALKKSKIVEFSEPYFDSYGTDTTQFLMSSVCVPLLDDRNNFLGLAGVDFSLDRLLPFIGQIVPYKGTKAMVVSNKGVVVAHPNREIIMKNIDDIWSGKRTLSEVIVKGETLSFDEELEGDSYFVSMAPIRLTNSNTPWSLVLLVPKASVLATVNQTIVLSLLICFAGLLLLGALIVFLARRLTKPLNKCVVFASEIGRGRLTSELDIKRNDEIGLLSVSLNNMANHLRSIVTNISEGSSVLIDTTNYLTRSSQQLIESADNQLESSNRANSSVSDLSTYVNTSNANTKFAKELSDKTTEKVKASSNRFAMSIESMGAIADKIQIINDIAFQTNILALNAAVEAARAGDAGRGFAVVAGEVRKLADMSKTAAEEIIALSNQTKQNSVEAGEILKETFTQISEFSQLVSEIHHHTNYQHESISQIKDTISGLKSMSSVNTEQAFNIDQIARELQGQTEKLKALTTKFNIN